MFGKKNNDADEQITGGPSSQSGIADDGFSDFFGNDTGENQESAGSVPEYGQSGEDGDTQGYPQQAQEVEYGQEDNGYNQPNEAYSQYDGYNQQGYEQQGYEQQGYEQQGYEQEEVQLSKKELKKLQKAEKKAAKAMGKSKGAGDAQQEVPIEKPKMMLYLVIDKPVEGLLDYFRMSGVNVSNIYSDIGEAKNEVIMQSDPLRIVIVDTGLGKFTTTTMRAELIDMMGISDDQNRTTVFYTDSALKVDTLHTLGKSGKDIDWFKYQSTALVVATLLSYNEEYILNSDSDNLADQKKTQANEVLNFKGLTSGLPDVPRMEITGFTSDAIMTHVVNNVDGTIPGFEVNY